MGNDPTETKQEESVWQVQLGDAGCMMTRRELDAALAREDIDPYTLVRQPGTLRWLSLGTVRGIDSETMNLTSNDVEIVPSDYKPSFVAPRPVPIETERERPPEELTKEELAVSRPRLSFLPRLVLVGAATFAGVFLAQHYLPSLSSATSYVRTHASAAATQASQASVASIAPPASALPPPATVASTTTPPAPVSVVARPAPAPSSPPEARVLLAAKPRTTPGRTASVRPASPTAKKTAPATTRSTTTAKAKPATPKAAAKPAPKPASAKPTGTTSTKPAPQPMKPDPPRPSRAR